MKKVLGNVQAERKAKGMASIRPRGQSSISLTFAILLMSATSIGFASEAPSCDETDSPAIEYRQCIAAGQEELGAKIFPVGLAAGIADVQRSSSTGGPSAGAHEADEASAPVIRYEADRQAMEEAYEALYQSMIDVGALECPIDLAIDGSSDRAGIISLDSISKFKDCLASTFGALSSDRPIRFSVVLEYRAESGGSAAELSIKGSLPTHDIDRHFRFPDDPSAAGALSHSGVFALEGRCDASANPECTLHPADIRHKGLEKLEFQVLRAFVDDSEASRQRSRRAPSNFINGGFDTADGGWTYRARGAQPAYSCRPISASESVWKAGLHDRLTGFPAPSAILLSEQAAAVARQRIDHHQMSQIVDVPANATEFSFFWRPNQIGGEIDLMVIAQDLTSGQETRIVWWQGGDLPWGHAVIPFTSSLISDLVGHTVNFIFIVCDSGNPKGFGRFDEIDIASEGNLNPDLFEEDDQDVQASPYSGTVEERNFSDDATDWVRFTTNATLVNTYSIVNPGANVVACLNLFSRLIDGSAGALLQRKCASTAGEIVSMSLVQASGAYLVKLENLLGASVDNSEYRFAINSSLVSPPDSYEDDDVYSQWKAYEGSPQSRNFADDTVDWIATYNNDVALRTYQTFGQAANADTCITVYSVTAEGAPGDIAGHDCDGGVGNDSRLLLLQLPGPYLVKVENENLFAGENTEYMFRILNDPL